MTGQSGIRHRRTLVTPVLGTLLLALLLGAGCRRQPSLEGTDQHIDLVSLLSRAEAWGPVELLDLGTGEHKLNLVDGLYFGETGPDGRVFAWSRGEETSILLTCPAPRQRTLVFRCRRLDVAPLDNLQVAVSLNGQPLGSFAPTTEYADHRLEAPAQAWQAGDNLLLLRYSDSVYLPDVIPGSTDARRVSAQLDAIRITSGLDSGGEPVTVQTAEHQLVYPAPADTAWYLQLPDHAVLACGGRAGLAAVLRVTLTPEGREPRELLSRRFRAGESAGPLVLDLAEWAGRFVRLTFSVDPVGRASVTAGPAPFHLVRPEIRVPAPDPAQGPVADGGARSAGPGDGPRPDVLVYVMDALRSGNLSSYGYPRRTSPVLDRISRRGLLFRNAFSQAPNTAPSVKSLFTGRFLPFTGHTVLSEEHLTLAEVFSRAGYATGLFSNNPYMGPELGFYRGFDQVAEEIFFRRQPKKDFARQATDAFIRWAAEVPDDQPFFAYIHTIHPHNPYEAPSPFGESYLSAGSGDQTEDLSTEALLGYVYGRRTLDKGTLQRMRDFYDGDIQYNDLQLGRLLAWLRGADRGRGTVFAFTADHGEELADHGGLLHGYTLYDEQIHVPLVLVPPGWETAPAGAGRGIREDVRLVDLAPTLFEMSGVSDPPPTEGQTLTGFVGGGSDAGGQVRTVYSSASSAGGLYTIRTGRWKYVFAPRTRHLWGMGQGLGRTRELHYLFDLQADPGEQINLAGRLQITRKALQTRLLEWIQGQERLDDDIDDQGRLPDFDEETRRRLLDLGYMEE
jgi:arylsulfatase A-like enzyme